MEAAVRGVCDAVWTADATGTGVTFSFSDPVQLSKTMANSLVQFKDGRYAMGAPSRTIYQRASGTEVGIWEGGSAPAVCYAESGAKAISDMSIRLLLASCHGAARRARGCPTG